VTLAEFIRKHGDAHCATLFGVKERTVASWRRGENFPRTAKAPQIVERTGGAVTIEGIYRANGSGKVEAEAAA
jgi:hypothetical protein